MSVYSATKAAIDGLTRSLARELGARGITVNSVAPRYIQTEMSYGLDEAQLEQITRRTPLGRLGDVDDVVGAVRFLASEEAGFVTGQVLVVDGGLTARVAGRPICRFERRTVVQRRYQSDSSRGAPS